ncbi:hypothetical protein DASC09_058490 [Saccharomycopsis crataegensis]|uniref:F-box domain-containing protein n=1 Tax=Saccharomycopsis crataegensis TaxID=43959 RepID=A0AAV5QWG9_9ASCO|nr:hypothetical protein DASC09_058490 [Saccharomycopsis crataegensis]
MEKLPPEIWLHITGYLSNSGLATLAQLNSRFQNIVNNSRLYKSIKTSSFESLISLHNIITSQDCSFKTKVEHLEFNIKKIQEDYNIHLRICADQTEITNFQFGSRTTLRPEDYDNTYEAACIAKHHAWMPEEYDNFLEYSSSLSLSSSSTTLNQLSEPRLVNERDPSDLIANISYQLPNLKFLKLNQITHSFSFNNSPKNLITNDCIVSVPYIHVCSMSSGLTYEPSRHLPPKIITKKLHLQNFLIDSSSISSISNSHNSTSHLLLQNTRLSYFVITQLPPKFPNLHHLELKDIGSLHIMTLAKQFGRALLSRNKLFPSKLVIDLSSQCFSSPELTFYLPASDPSSSSQTKECHFLSNFSEKFASHFQFLRSLQGFEIVEFTNVDFFNGNHQSSLIFQDFCPKKISNKHAFSPIMISEPLIGLHSFLELLSTTSNITFNLDRPRETYLGNGRMGFQFWQNLLAPIYEPSLPNNINSDRDDISRNVDITKVKIIDNLGNLLYYY